MIIKKATVIYGKEKKGNNMSHPKDIAPINKGGFWHGYCKEYHDNGQLMWEGVCVNGGRCGYFESYWSDGSVDKYWTGYWMNGNRISDNNKQGYCYIWDKRELIGFLKNIKPTNKEGLFHGYCKDYWSNGKLACKGVMVNGRDYGYIEEYNGNGKLIKEATGYFLHGKKVSDDNNKGYCIIWDRRTA